MRSQLGAINALAVRDWRIVKTYPMTLILRYPAAVISMFIFFYISELVGQPTVRLGDFEASYFDFAVIGLLIAGITASATGAFISTIGTEQSTGSLELLVGSPAGRVPVLAGLSITPMFLAIGEVAVYLFLGLGVLGSGFSLTAALTTIPILALLWIVFAALGVLSAGMTVVTKRGDPIGVFLTQVTSLLAGSLFPVSLLPAPLEALSLLIPTRYALDASRAALLGGEQVVAIVPELSALAAFAAVLAPLSIAFFGWSVNVAKRIGTLGTG